MTVHELNLKSLMEDLDGGRIHEAFMSELRRVAVDCEDRPADNKVRKIALELKLTPICDDDSAALCDVIAASLLGLAVGFLLPAFWHRPGGGR